MTFMHREFPGSSGRLAVALTAAALVSGVGLVRLLGEQENQPIEFTHNIRDAPAPVTSAVFGSGPALRPGDKICTTSGQQTANVDTDCEKTGPSNETSIAVNPANELNMIGGANDYQLAINPGGQVSENVLSRAHVTFDGGQTWSEYPIFFQSGSAYQGTGDPAVAFDAAGHAYYATLGFRFVGPTNALNPDVIVSNSGDGGKTWSSVRVASGSGNEGSVGDLLDKEYIAAWGNGNAIVTWGDFRLAQKGSFVSARIFSSVTHDGGATWSAPKLISGALDQAFVSVPTVAADGRIYVAFLNTTDPQTFRDDYELVEVSPATGAAVFGPVKVATTIDGATDYPIAFGRQTYHDSLFRTWAAGNITADPTDARAPGDRLVRHAQQPTARSVRSVRRVRRHELRRHREPVVRPRPDVERAVRAGARWRPVHAMGRVRSHRHPAHRVLRSAVRSRQPHVWLYAGHAGIRRGHAVQPQSADDGALGSNERESMVCHDGERVFPVCDDVSRRLLQHRDDGIGRCRGVLDRFAGAGVLRRPMRKQPGRLLCDGALTLTPSAAASARTRETAAGCRP